MDVTERKFVTAYSAQMFPPIYNKNKRIYSGVTNITYPLKLTDKHPHS